MITEPKDDELIPNLPRYIREARREFFNTVQKFQSQNCAFEPGTMTGDAVYLDQQSNVYRRSLVGTAAREKFTGIADVERKLVTHLGIVEVPGLDFEPGQQIFVSSMYEGHLTNTLTTLAVGIIIVPEWLLVGQSAASARYYFDRMNEYVDQASDAAVAAAASATSAQQSATTATTAAANAASSAQQAALAAQLSSDKVTQAQDILDDLIDTTGNLFPAPVAGQYLGWDSAGHLVTMPVVIPDNGDDNPITDGGVGDGSTDTAPIIQNIISGVAPGGKAKVYLPPGVWKLSSALLASGISLTIQGSGKFTTTLLVDNAVGGIQYQGSAATGLVVSDLTFVAGRLDSASGVALDASWPAGAAASGEHLLIRNVRFIPKTGYDKTRSWFATPIKLANAGGSTLVDVESDFNGPTVDVVNTATAKGLRLVACSSKGVLLRARGGQDAVQVLGCSAESSTNALDLAATGGQGLVVQGCRFRADDVPVLADGYEGVVVQGSDIGSRNTSSYSPSVFLANCKRVAVTGNSFGDATTTEAGVHVALASTSDFIVEGNAFAGQYTESVSLTSASKGLVSCNTARGGQNLATVANCSDVQVRGNTAFDLSGDLVAQSGTNTSLVIQGNIPPGNTVTRSADGGTITVAGAPDGNVNVTASGNVTVTDILGGHEGMQVFFTNATTAQVVFAHNPAKIVCYNWTNSPPLYNGGHVSFKKVNGVWLQMTYGT